MAKKQLTVEEKLQAALVPVEEQPYKVPENWCWVRLGATLNELKNGTTIKQDKSGVGYFVTRIESLQEQTIDFSRLGNIVDESKIKETDWYKDGDVALSHINSAEHVGKTALITEDMLPLVHGMNLLRLRFNELLKSRLFQYFTRSFQYKAEIRARINMAVNQVSINQKNLSNIEFPLAPIQEQSRIVARVESLFSKLDEAKEKIQEVLDGADLRRAAILHQAFTGKLTEKWRKENGVSDNSWEEKSLGKVCKSIFDGDHMPPPKTDAGVPFLVISNVNTGYLSFEDTRYVSAEYYNNISETRKPEKGDVLYTLVGSYGIPVVVDTEREFCFQRHMGLLKPDCVETYYLWYALQTREFFNKATGIAKGTAQLTVPIKKLRELTINVPSKTEQQEIVRLLDNLLTREQSTVAACEEALTTIDTLKKSILARAFRGELGTNDPSEASAKELLQEILAS